MNIAFRVRNLNFFSIKGGFDAVGDTRDGVNALAGLFDPDP